jgi:Na+/melibiose symporter-like transporter
MALAMGLQLAIARFGTATAILIAPMIVTQKAAGEMYLLTDTNRPAMIGLAVLGIGAILWAVFVGLDARFDRQTGETDKVATAEEDKFRISDIWKVLTNPRFLMIAVLCVTFYCTVIRFKKFGVSILLPLFGVDLDIATVLLAMIPFFTILFTPLFGALVDKVGKATLWMIAGSAMVLVSHLIITFAPQGVPIYAYISIALLGIGYSLVPSAMWPSVPKIIPEKNLGTAYSLIYWVQNLGMWFVPKYVGRIFDREITIPADAASAAEMKMRQAQEVSAALHAEYVFVFLGVVAVAVAVTMYLSRPKDRLMSVS